ncbi:MAG: hypothetical protein F6J93_07275 [Oscillatoria sp. SIO1A7]|nr:hypothetical protein [Oscillatoria sp. SIO1A7]
MSGSGWVSFERKFTLVFTTGLNKSQRGLGAEGPRSRGAEVRRGNVQPSAYSLPCFLRFLRSLRRDRALCFRDRRSRSPASNRDRVSSARNGCGAIAPTRLFAPGKKLGVAPPCFL